MKVQDYSEYREFSSSKETRLWAEENYSELLHGDRYMEVREIIKEYTGNTYIPINSLLRGKLSLESREFITSNFGDYEYFKPDVLILYEMLRRHPLKENIVVYRAIKWEALFKLCNKKPPRKGAEFCDKAFLSTSLVLASAIAFSKANNCPCILKMYLPKGIFGAYVSNYDEHDLLDENEFLIAPNTHFVIKSVNLCNRTSRIECLAIQQQLPEMSAQG